MPVIAIGLGARADVPLSLASLEFRMLSTTRRTFATVLALAALSGSALTLAGCAGASTGVARGPTLSPEQRLAAFDLDDAAFAKLGYRRDWSGFPVVAGGGSIKLVEVRGDTVFALDSGSTVTALEGSNGSILWANQVGNTLTRFVAINRMDSGLLVSSDAEAFVLNIKTGAYISRKSFDKLVNTAPAIVGNIGYYGTPVGELLGHNISTGFKFRGVALTGAIDEPPIIVGSTIAAVTQAGDVMFVHTDSGTLAARTKIFGGLATRPVTDGENLYLASVDQSVYCFSPSAKQVWRYKTSVSLRSQPAIHGGAMLLHIPGEGFVSLSTASGSVNWKSAAITGEVIGVRKGDLLIWDGEFLQRVDAAHGEVVAKFKMPGVKSFAFDQFVDGNLFIISESGVITRFATR